MLQLEEAEAYLRRPDILILAGSGISVDAPCNAPSGLALISRLLDLIVPTADLRRRFQQLAFPDKYKLTAPKPILRFEHLLSALTEVGVDPQLDLLKLLLADREPNECHHSVAALLKCGARVITTNFDECLERASAGSVQVFECPAGSTLSLLASTTELPASSLMKFHGSLGMNIAATVRFISLQAAPLLQQGSIIRNRITTSLRRHPLLVIGYSGMDDFDLVPLLLQTKSDKAIVWVDHASGDDSQLLNWETLARRFQIADCFYSKAEYLIYRIGMSVRPADRVFLLRCHTSNLLAQLTERSLSRQEEVRDNRLRLIEKWLSENTEPLHLWFAAGFAATLNQDA